MKWEEKRAAIVEAIKAAAYAAEKADPVHDGGTCNFDTPAIRIKRMKSEYWSGIAEEAGVEIKSFRCWGAGWHWVMVPLRGQAARRSAMMEAAMAVLSEAAKRIEGLEVRGYYQMD